MKFKAKAIADELGISPSTVSLALNGKNNVNSETRRKIFNLIEKKGFDLNALYTPNKNSSDTILLIVYLKHGHLLFDTSFLNSVFEGVAHRANMLGYQLPIYYHYELKSTFRTLQQKIASINPVGIVLVATEMYDVDIEKFLNFKIPVVLLDRANNGMPIDAVSMDNANGMREAVHCLYENGHREIGAMFGASRVQNIVERKRGFSSAMDNMGLTIDENFVWNVGNATDECLACLKAKLDEHPVLPTAFVAANDVVAATAIQVFNHAGIQVPDDVSIIGFDDTTICEVVSPPLTTIAAYKQRMGELAVQRLHSLVNEPIAENVNITVNTHLISRESIKNISKKQEE